MNAGTRWSVPALAAATLGAALSAPFFAQPLRPWPDQGQVLHAAVRHARGLGLSVPVVTGADVTTLGAARLTYFPPFYAYALSAALRASGAVESPDAAAAGGPHLATGRAVGRFVKATNAAALLLGVCGWCLLAATALRSRALVWLFAALLVTSGGALVPKGGTADYLMWAAMPWWLSAVLAADFAAEARRWRHAAAAALAAGLIGALLVGVRWAAVVLVPTAGLFWLVRSLQPAADGWSAHLRSVQGRRAFAARMGLAVAAGLPAVASYFLLTLINRAAAGGAGSLLSFLEPRWDWHRLATLYPFESVFAVPLGLEPLLTRAWRALDPARDGAALGAVFRVLLPGAALAALVAAARRPAPACDTPASGRTVTLGLATLVTLVAFLAFLSLRYTWSFADWSYLEEARYYRPTWPLAALVWLVLLGRLPSTSMLRRAAVAVLALGALYVGQAQVRFAAARLQAHDESWELIEHVRALERRPGLHVVLDNDLSDYVVTGGRRLLARSYPDPEQAPALTASRPAELWMVRRLKEPTAYVTDREWDKKRFDAVRARFGGRRTWTSSAGNYELWHASIGPSSEAP